jgi:hypothetical protein
MGRYPQKDEKDATEAYNSFSESKIEEREGREVGSGRKPFM